MARNTWQHLLTFQSILSFIAQSFNYPSTISFKRWFHNKLMIPQYISITSLFFVIAGFITKCVNIEERNNFISNTKKNNYYVNCTMLVYRAEFKYDCKFPTENFLINMFKLIIYTLLLGNHLLSATVWT